MLFLFIGIITVILVVGMFVVLYCEEKDKATVAKTACRRSAITISPTVIPSMSIYSSEGRRRNGRNDALDKAGRFAL